MLYKHWIPAHRDGSDAGTLATWAPRIVKVITTDETIPYLEDIPPSATIVVRHHPMSEMFGQRGFVGGTVRSGIDAAHGGSPRDRRGPQVIAAGAPPVTRAASRSPATIGREHAALCRRIANWANARGVPDSRLCFEGLNEPQLWAGEPPATVAAYYLAFIQGLHEVGLRGVVGNFGVGWPGNGGVADAPVDWAFFAAVIVAMLPGDFLGLHEYWALQGPTQNWRWWAGRFLQCPFRVPILITECGIDTGVTGNWFGGWQDLPGTMEEKAARYVDELLWYARQGAADGRVQGIFPFTYDIGSSEWQKFNLKAQPWLTAFFARKAEFPTPVPVPPAALTLADVLRVEFGSKFTDMHDSLPQHDTLDYRLRQPSAIARLVLHHTATAPTATWTAVARYHVNTKHYPGIGYHIGIHADGRVALLNDAQTISYHCGDATKPGDENADSLAIACMGNYETDAVPDSLYPLVLRVAGAVGDYLGRAVPLVGHRDVASGTVCPGRYLYAKLRAPDGFLPVLWAEAAKHDLLSINPDAALCKAGYAAKLWPTSNEYQWTFEGVSYTGQRFRDPRGAGVTVLYCVTGDWANVKRESRTA